MVDGQVYHLVNACWVHGCSVDELRVSTLDRSSDWVCHVWIWLVSGRFNRGEFQLMYYR
jgi:hypothetical protein